jgi:hypothetical protein
MKWSDIEDSGGAGTVRRQRSTPRGGVQDPVTMEPWTPVREVEQMGSVRELCWSEVVGN